ncbi:hypothetical protein Scep_024418 [Stephania cephalantha]|uniref:Uncharacterized protein n=1 Tax=Stephania cephalantha TaxID=152367 RepID=A0AAP0F3P8_9MAGN
MSKEKELDEGSEGEEEVVQREKEMRNKSEKQWIHLHPLREKNSGVEKEKKKRQRKEKKRGREKKKRKIMRKGEKEEEEEVEEERSLDRAQASKVNWDPYADIWMDDDGITEITLYTGTLKLLSIEDSYHPDIFLRQMEYVQRIPLAPYKPTRVNRVAPNYLPWFIKISYPLLENPEYNTGDPLDNDDDDLLDTSRGRSTQNGKLCRPVKRT